MNSLRSLLFGRIANRGDADTIVSLQENRSLSGSALLERVDASVAALAARGLRPGQRVMAILANSIALAVLYLACLRGRYVLIPVGPGTPNEDLRYIAELTKPQLVLADDIFSVASFSAIPWNTQIVADLASTNFPESDAVPEDVFVIMFTSGSTSRPKAVVHRAEGMLGNAQSFNQFLNVDSTVRMLHVMPMYYMAGLLNTILCPLIAGGAVVLDAAFSPRTALLFWRHAIDSRINAFWLSPTMAQVAMRLDRTVESARYAREKLRFCFVGTAPLPASLYSEFADRYGVPLLQSYGLSELLLLSVDRPERPRSGSVGMILPEVATRLGADGELLISTPFAFSGYLDSQTGAAPDATTAEHMRCEFKTGDLAEIDISGRLIITGRKKDLIIVGGVNVSPTAVEYALSTHPTVRQVAVLGVNDPTYGERPVAFVSLVDGVLPEGVEESLRVHAQAHLPEAAWPAHYILREVLPAGPTGKIQKQKLAAQIIYSAELNKI